LPPAGVVNEVGDDAAVGHGDCSEGALALEVVATPPELDLRQIPLADLVILDGV
jgi:hypothetical protein